MRSGPLIWVEALRAVLALTVLAFAVSPAGAGTPRREAAWSRESLPASVRDRVHIAAKDVPAFPMSDGRLLRPRDWPQAMTIAGVPCALRIHAWDDDDAIAVASLDDLESDEKHRVMLFYDVASSEWNTGNAGWGPRYLWNEEGKLIQRIWYEPDSSKLVTHDYTYYKGGQLLGYSVRTEVRRARELSARPYEFLSEFYTKDGRLMAIAYENMAAGSRDSVYAWMGAVVPYDEFRMKSHVLYSSAHPGDR